MSLCTCVCQCVCWCRCLHVHPSRQFCFANYTSSESACACLKINPQNGSYMTLVNKGVKRNQYLPPSCPLPLSSPQLSSRLPSALPQHVYTFMHPTPSFLLYFFSLYSWFPLCSTSVSKLVCLELIVVLRSVFCH